MNWNEYYLSLLEPISLKSKDKKTKVGCVIVGPNHEIRSTGFNGLPRGVNDSVEERYQKPAKQLWVEHAERNAIYSAARVGTPLEGCSIYITLFPCCDCAKAIIQAGIVKVYYSQEAMDNWNSENYKGHFETATEMLTEAGVRIITLYGNI